MKLTVSRTELLSKEDAISLFEDVSRTLEVKRDALKDMIMYNLTDGNRTSSHLRGWDAYFDGGLFGLRLFNCLNQLGSKSAYIMTVAEKHEMRDNYKDIVKGMSRLVETYVEYAEKEGMRLTFVGNLESMASNTHEEVRKFYTKLVEVEEYTSGNSNFNAYILMNYSETWAVEQGAELFKTLPTANVIVRHAKGYINGGLWLPGKLEGNTFVYVQNGSSNLTWTDREIVTLVALSLRSMMINHGTQYSKKYGEGEIENLREKREIELSFTHKCLSETAKKRMVIFSPVGPEVYEF